mgnify:CR=1 FL=1
MNKPVLAWAIGRQLGAIVSLDARNISDLEGVRLFRYHMRHILFGGARLGDQVLCWWTLEAGHFIPCSGQPRHAGCANQTGSRDVKFPF